MKPYTKLAYVLVLSGAGILTFERFGLSHANLHLAGWLVSVLALTPVVLIVAGCLVFMIGKARRL